MFSLPVWSHDRPVSVMTQNPAGKFFAFALSLRYHTTTPLAHFHLACALNCLQSSRGVHDVTRKPCGGRPILSKQPPDTVLPRPYSQRPNGKFGSFAHFRGWFRQLHSILLWNGAPTAAAVLPACSPTARTRQCPRTGSSSPGSTGRTAILRQCQTVPPYSQA